MSVPRFRIVAGIAEAKRLAGALRIRAPHHTASVPGLVGSIRRRPGTAPLDLVIQPGECSLADGGVLLLDDLGEFKRVAVEAIAAVWHRQASRYLVVSPHHPDVTIEIPTRFDIYATSEACPCGRPDRCACSDGARMRFDARLRECRRLFEGDGS